MAKKNSTPRPDPRELALPCTGVETHAHLDMEHFDKDRAEVLQRAREAGVAWLGQVFLGPAAYLKGREFFAGHKDVFFLLGIHPHDAASCDEKSLETMRKAFVENPGGRLRALGETGLDHYWMHATEETQQRAFCGQLELALELDLPVVIHSRDADERTLHILDEMGLAGRPLLWHCFGRDAAFARELLQRDWHISIPGPVTFPKSEALREAILEIPLERLVLETDCPYLTPAPYRGKRNEPAYLAFTARAVATVKGIDIAELWSKCGETARGFFGLG